MVWATGLLWKAWPLWIGSPRGTVYRVFLASLIEDFADEWLTKAMFHYRWAYDADIQYASLRIADDCFPAQKGAARRSGKAFREAPDRTYAARGVYPAKRADYRGNLYPDAGLARNPRQLARTPPVRCPVNVFAVREKESQQRSRH